MGKVGRKSKYEDDFPERVYDYMRSFHENVDHEGNGLIHESVGIADKLKNEYLENIIPTVAGLALYLGIHRDTVYKYRQRYEEFDYAVSQMLLLQEVRLCNLGLMGNLNPRIATLLLSTHGYTESTKTDVTSNGNTLEMPTFSITSVKSGDD